MVMGELGHKLDELHFCGVLYPVKRPSASRSEW